MGTHVRIKDFKIYKIKKLKKKKKRKKIKYWSFNFKKKKKIVAKG